LIVIHDDDAIIVLKEVKEMAVAFYVGACHWAGTQIKPNNIQ